MTARFGKLAIVAALAALLMAPSAALGHDPAAVASAIYCSLAAALFVAAMLKWLIVSLIVRPSGAWNPLAYLILAAIEGLCVLASFRAGQFVFDHIWRGQEGTLISTLLLYVIFVALATTPNWFVFRWYSVKAGRVPGAISILYGAGMAMILVVVVEVLQRTPLQELFYEYFARR